MNEQEMIIAKIKEAAYNNVNKKLEAERKVVENKINNELTDVERCLSYIKNKMVFKIIVSKYSTTKEYKLADENTFFEDYTKESGYSWNKGVQFLDSSKKPYEPLFKVNGESYYDMRYIIRHYEDSFDVYAKKLNDLRENFNELEEMANNLKRQEPCIKKLIEQYKKVEIDESFTEDLCDEY